MSKRLFVGLAILFGLFLAVFIFLHFGPVYSVPATVEIRPSMGRPQTNGVTSASLATVTLHADTATTPVLPFWIDCIGTCNGLLWRERTAELAGQLAYTRQRLGVKEVRFHNILSLVPDPLDKAPNFSGIDRVYDAILKVGVRPLVEVSFMPHWLASGPKTIFKYKANVTPPFELVQWKLFVTDFARHLEGRYGAAEVRKWRFEIWNEPDLTDFWTGTREEYYQLYRAACDGLKAADPKLIVGGPSAALSNADPYGGLVPWFLLRTDKDRTPIDFLSWHVYGGKMEEPVYDLRRTAELRSWFDDISPLSKARKLPLLITEWNVTPSPVRNYMHDTALNAAFALNMVREARGKCDLFSFWTMSDLFAEHDIPGEELSGGFGLLSLRGLEKPVFKAFEMLNLTRGAKWVAPKEGIDAPVLASWDAGRQKLVVIVWNWPYDMGGKTNRTVAAPREVSVTISGLPKRRYAGAIYPLDDNRANLCSAWHAMGKPAEPTVKQRAELVQAARLRPVRIGGRVAIGEETKVTWKAYLKPGDCCALVLSAKRADLDLEGWKQDEKLASR